MDQKRDRDVREFRDCVEVCGNQEEGEAEQGEEERRRGREAERGLTVSLSPLSASLQRTREGHGRAGQS